jgi:hypothetical protein
MLVDCQIHTVICCSIHTATVPTLMGVKLIPAASTPLSLEYNNTPDGIVTLYHTHPCLLQLHDFFTLSHLVSLAFFVRYT